MVQLHVGGIEIDFPFEPYGVQKQYMSRVIAALRDGHNACLESPTGTGKSLSLLCSVLAWRETYIAALQLRSNGGVDEKLFKAVGLTPACPRDPSPLTGVGGALGEQSDLALPRSFELQGAVRDSSSCGANAVSSAVADTLASVVVPNAGRPELKAPRIVYTSRTHSQLSQAIGELKATVYRPYMTVLASRDQLCIHDVASKFSGARLSSTCRQLTSSSRRGCKYHLSVMSPRDYENRSHALLQELRDEGPKDIEDLGVFGAREGACPFYLTRAAAGTGEVEVIFMPYNYLVDRAARESIDLDWGNDIVIVDEAHNLESVCTESLSFDLTPSTRAGCQKELLDCIERAMCPGGVTVPALEEMSKSAEGQAAVIGTENRDAMEFRVLLVILRQIDDAIDNMPLQKKNVGLSGGAGNTHSTFPGSFLRELFCSVDGFSEETVPLVLEVLDRAVDGSGYNRSTSEEKLGVPVSGRNDLVKNTCLRSLQKALQVLFDPVCARFRDSFKTVIQPVDASNPTLGRTISYWCFSPAVAMSQISALGIRSLLLTSGTLSPMDSFSRELGLSFKVSLEGRHVIASGQVYGCIVRKGPDGVSLSSSFKSRERDEYKLSLGRSLVRLAEVIPDGMLVFFPSYRAMDGCLQFWRTVGVGDHGQKPSIVELLYQRKQLVWEPRSSGEFGAAILAHQNHVRSGRGSILFAVCRGKVSEGIDFSDAYGRAVVLAGIPYPAAYDPRVLLKKEYLNEKCRRVRDVSDPSSSREAIHMKGNDGVHAFQGHDALLSGEDWYTLQAIRAVNQAVGRVIRHKNDFGCVYLFDERFSGQVGHQISKWLKPFLSVSPSFHATIQTTTNFFQTVKSSGLEMKKNVKLVRPQIRGGIPKTSSQHPDSRIPETSIDADSQIAAASEAIAKFLQPQRLLNEVQAGLNQISAGLVEEPSGSTVAAVQPFESGVEQDRLLHFLDHRPAAESEGRHAEMSRRRGENSQDLNLVEPSRVDIRKTPTASSEFLRLRDSAKLARSATHDRASDPRRRSRVRNVREPVKEQTGGRKRLKVSEAAKALFDRKDHFMDTFQCLRRILGLATRLSEEDGPLLSSTARNELLTRAKAEIVSLVESIRWKSSANLPEGQVDSFLEMLRHKIPPVLASDFDAAVSSKKP